MISTTVEVKHELGLHLRAAARLATLTATAAGSVRLTANAVTVDGKSLLGITSLLAGSPIYATFLVTFGTIAGRHIFFANMARKIFGRFVPASLRPKIACPPALEKAAKGGGPGSV